MKIQNAIIMSIAVGLLASQPVNADAPSAFGSGFDVQDFYKPFTLEEITPENQQKWPYYKLVKCPLGRLCSAWHRKGQAFCQSYGAGTGGTLGHEHGMERWEDLH